MFSAAHVLQLVLCSQKHNIGVVESAPSGLQEGEYWNAKKRITGIIPAAHQQYCQRKVSYRSITCIIYLYSHIYVHTYACRVYVVKQLLMTHTSVLGVPSRPVLSVSSLPWSGSLSPSCCMLQADGRQLLFSTVFPHLCQPPLRSNLNSPNLFRAELGTKRSVPTQTQASW